MGASGSTLQAQAKVKGKYSPGSSEVVLSPNASVKIKSSKSGSNKSVSIRNSQDSSLNSTISFDRSHSRGKSFDENLNRFNEIVDNKQQELVQQHMNYNDIEDEEVRENSKRSIVNGFLEQRVAIVSERIVRFKIPAIKQAMSSQSLKVGKNPIGSLSLRGMAKRHHFGQNHTHINTNSFGEILPLIHSFKFKNKNKNKGKEQADETKVIPEEKPLPDITVQAEPKPKSTQEVNSSINPPVNTIKSRSGLSLTIEVDNDEADWIKISEDEDDDELTPKAKRDNHIGDPKNALNAESFTMTQTGTIKFKDFGEEIAKSGIVSVVSDSSKLPMRERLVMLRKLGQGCSSIVYKALDITELRLVALKMVPFYEKEKRHQMVRELSALFQVLRRKQVDSKANIQCMHVALLFELKKANNRNNIVDFKSTRLGSTRVGSTRLGSDRLRSVSMRRGSATMNPKTFKIYPREYIVDFYDAFSDVEDGGVGMMMEYMDGGSLQDIADAGGCQDENVLANVAVQALAGLDFLHSCNQIHRDVKPANFLINLNGDVKVADLGILRQNDIGSLFQEEVETGASCEDRKDTYMGSGGEANVASRMHRTNTFVGTATYMSPERLTGDEYSYPCDIWSFGLSLLTVALGRLPLDTKGGFWGILQSVRDSPPPTLPAEGPWSNEFRDFLSRCLIHDPNLRFTTSDLLRHPFLSKAKPDEPEFAESGPIEELEAIVASLCAHLKTVRGNVNSDRNGSATDSTRNKYNNTTIYDMAHQILFGQPSDSNDEGDSTDSCERLAVLADQLHLNPSLATQVAREALEDFRYQEEASGYDPGVPTPKQVHSRS